MIRCITYSSYSSIRTLVIVFGIITETTCLIPTQSVNGGEVFVDKLTVGSKVTYRARDRFRHVSGDLVRTCREDQLWTGKQPVFEGITICIITDLMRFDNRNTMVIRAKYFKIINTTTD